MEEKINKHIQELLSTASDSFIANSSLADDLGFDSLDHVQLTMALEEEFDIEIPDDDWIKFKTVQDIYNYIKTRLG